MRSIRSRVLATSLVASWVLILVSAVIWYRTAESLLVGQFDDALAMRAQSLATLMVETEEGVELEFADELTPEFMPGPNAGFFQAWTAAGVVVERSKSLGEHDLPYARGSLEKRECWDLVLPDGRNGRACRIAAAVLPEETPEEEEADVPPAPSGLTATIVVAQGRAGLDDALASLWISVLLVGGLVAFGNLILLYLILTRGMKPLDRLGSEVRGLDPADLPEQLGFRAERAELEPIVTGLDVLLGRIRAAIDREKRTTSNIAHEMMTPIAELRALTEVALKWPEKSDYTQEALRQSHAVALQMNGITETILALAHSEQGAMACVSEEIPLDAFLQGLVGRLEALASAKSLDIEVQVPEGLEIRSDSALLDIVLSNLLSNALTYGPSGSTVQVTAGRDGAQVCIEVCNAVTDLESVDLTHLTEPFWRKDAARTGGQHAGLGLTLAAEVSAVLGGSLTFLIHEGRFHATFTLPD